MFSETNEYEVDSCEMFGVDSTTTLVAVGSYHLSPLKTKLGSIKLFTNIPKKTTLTKEIKTNAILDLKWLNNNPILAAADANGSLTLYDQKLSQLSSWKSEDPSSLLLSLSWQNIPSNQKLLVSQTNGSISLLDIDKSYTQTLIKTWKAHEMEAWICAFEHSNCNIVYSGADDTLFKGWDIRTDTSSPTFTNKSHQMGVTSIHSSLHSPFNLATGSYDEHIRIWDTRNFKTPISETRVGDGGVWRIKFHPTIPNRLVAACMHDGFRVYLLEEDGKLTEEMRFMEHKSLAYGVDWLRRDGKDLVGTGSFYDRLFCLWEL